MGLMDLPTSDRQRATTEAASTHYALARDHGPMNMGIVAFCACLERVSLSVSML